MICLKCGFLNPDNTQVCLSCGAKLITNVNPKFGDLSEFDNNNIVAQLISKFEDNFSTIFQALTHLEEKTEFLENQIMELKSGLNTLVDLLSEKDLIKREKFSHVWENNILQHIAKQEEKEKFLSMKEEIVLIEENSKKEKLEEVLNKAESLYNTGSPEKALEILEKAAGKHKNNYKLNLLLGQIFYLKKQYTKALQYLFKSFALNPEHYETNLYLGIMLNETGETEKAKDFLTKAIELKEDDYLPFFILGTIFYFEEEYKVAELFLTHAANLEKKAEILFFLALVKKARKRKKSAEKLLKEVIEIEPDFEDAYYQLGMIYLELNWNKKARTMFEKVLSLNPSRFELNAFKTGKTYDFLGIKINEELTAISKKCEQMVENGDIEKGIQCYSRVLESFPENPAITVKLASLLIENGNTQKGIELAKRLIKPGASENILLHAYTIIHSALSSEGKLQEAIETLKQFEKEAKTDYSKSYCYITLAFDYIESGDLKKAEKYSKDGLKLAPRDLRHFALDALGWVNYKMKRYQKARELLEESLSIEPNNQSAIYHLGMVNLSLKDKGMAKKLFDRLIELKDGEQFSIIQFKQNKDDEH